MSMIEREYRSERVLSVVIIEQYRRSNRKRMAEVGR